MPADWQRRGSRTTGDYRIFRVRTDTATHPRTGLEREVHVIESPDWVNVIALTPEGRVVLVEHYRHGRRRVTLEIPGGMLEPGEEPVAAGLRELAEETGYAGAPATLLGSCEPNPAIQENRCYFVLVESAVRVAEPRPDEGEDIDVRLVALPDVPALIEDGAISHALVIAAFARYFASRRGLA
jgi:8-oxo-dGTP pyrophosphatase MutT (NUDIX family)